MEHLSSLIILFLHELLPVTIILMVKTATIFKVISNSFKLKVKPILLWLQVIIINSLEHDQN